MMSNQSGKVKAQPLFLKTKSTNLNRKPINLNKSNITQNSKNSASNNEKYSPVRSKNSSLNRSFSNLSPQKIAKNTGKLNPIFSKQSSATKQNKMTGYIDKTKTLDTSRISNNSTSNNMSKPLQLNNKLFTPVRSKLLVNKTITSARKSSSNNRKQTSLVMTKLKSEPNVIRSKEPQEDQQQ